jgi:hypothetical protein
MRKSLLKRIAELEREIHPARDPKEVPPAAQEIMDRMRETVRNLEAKNEKQKTN